MYYRYLLILGITLAFCQCNPIVREVGNGVMITENIEVGEFEEIIVGGNFDIILRKGNQPSVKVTADENLHQYIEVEVRGDRLYIETTETIRSKEGLELNIEYNQLTAVEVSGAANMMNEGVLEGDYLNVNMSGAGTLELNVALKVLKVSISGAGSAELMGEVREENIRMSGAGDLRASGLISQRCDISISGVGSAVVHVTERLDAEVSGVGGITYSGNPQEVQSDVSGLGSIKRSDE